MRAVQGGIGAGCTGGTSRTGLRSRSWRLPSPSARGRTGASRAATPAPGAAPGPQRRRGALPGSGGAQCCSGTVTTRPGAAAAPPDPAAPCPKTAALLHACRPALNDCSLCPKPEAHCLKFATLYPISAPYASRLRPRGPGLQPLFVVFRTHLPPARLRTPNGAAPGLLHPSGPAGTFSLTAAQSTPGYGCGWRERPMQWGNPSPPHIPTSGGHRATRISPRGVVGRKEGSDTAAEGTAEHRVTPSPRPPHRSPSREKTP